MADDAIELGFEAFDRVTNRYHDTLFDHTTQRVLDRRSGKMVKPEELNEPVGRTSRPRGPQRRSSSLPPDTMRGGDDDDMARAEEGFAGSRQLTKRDTPYPGGAGRRDRVYVDEQGQDYFVPASRYPNSDERYRRDQGERDGSRRRNRSAKPAYSESGRSRHSSRHGLIPENKKGPVHHIAAALAGGVAGGFVGQTAGKGDIKIALAGAVIGALGVGLVDQRLEKKVKD